MLLSVQLVLQENSLKQLGLLILVRTVVVEATHLPQVLPFARSAQQESTPVSVKAAVLAVRPAHMHRLLGRTCVIPAERGKLAEQVHHFASNVLLDTAAIRQIHNVSPALRVHTVLHQALRLVLPVKSGKRSLNRDKVVARLVKWVRMQAILVP